MVRVKLRFSDAEVCKMDAFFFLSLPSENLVVWYLFLTYNIRGREVHSRSSYFLLVKIVMNVKFLLVLMYKSLLNFAFSSIFVCVGWDVERTNVFNS